MIRSFLLGAMEKTRSTLVRSDWIRKIPGRGRVYDYLFQRLWSQPEVLDIQGSKMYLNVREPHPGMRKTFQSYAMNREHEAETTRLFRSILKEGNVVVDLGANIGYYSLMASRKVGAGGRVYSFEPEPTNFRFFRKNIDLNGYANITPVNKAVSERNGTTQLFICEYDTGHHTINRFDGIAAYQKHRVQEGKTAVDIETVTLDDFLRDKERAVDVMKVDVEGAEVLAFRGMDRVLRESPNLRMIVEFFPLLIRSMGCSPEEWIDGMTGKYGFEISIIGEDYSAKDRGMVKVRNAEELMRACAGETDHLNLYLARP